MFLDTRKSEVSIWLVKFPSFLAEKIKNYDELDIGTLQIIPATKNTPPITKFLIKNMPDLPQEYELTFTNIENNLYVIDDDKIEGRITRQCRVQPVLNKEYFEFQKLRSVNLQKTRSTRVIHYQDKVKPSASEVDIIARKRRKYISENKRERLEKNEAIDLIFGAFEKHSLWSVKDLSDFTGQPVAYVQELVDELCTPKRTDYRNLYELKPEYRNKNEEDGQ
ncbi:General transcription factor IIF subunit 2 [Dictyocoela muelleri]|nr:General transcription factor IIF subunit 2 [Dictyocoela muelleri]